MFALKNNDPVEGRNTWRKEAVGGTGIGHLFWFCLCFFLFVILGPFTAPLVLVVVFTAQGDGRLGEPEPVDERAGESICIRTWLH